MKFNKRANNKQKIKIIILFFLLVTLPNILAKEDITFTLQQEDYYFKIGEEAILELIMLNTYEKNISGQLHSTITQNINQPGISQSSSSSNSIPLKVPTKESKISLTLGTSKSQATWNIKLSFEYYEKENRAVNLDNIKIHFVQDESQKQNEQNQQQSKSQNQASQSQQQIQEQMKKIQQQNQKSQPQTQNKLTNSQNSQDTSALKKQMQEQNQQLQQTKEQFKKTLEQNQQLQQEHQKMLDKGYKMKNVEVNPTNPNSGDFKMNYEKENGNEAQISGEMKNNKLENMKTSSSEELQQALDQLQQNKKFQKISEQLKNENFQNIDTNIEKNENETKIEMQYTNEKNQTATITAEIKNQAVENVKLEKGSNHIFSWIIILLILAITAYLLYQKNFPKKQKEIIITKQVPQKHYNYKTEAKSLLKKSKKLFQENSQKDAYELASQSIRLYLSHKHSLKKEITSDEIIKYLKSKNQNTSKIKQTLDLCSLVEFAKYSPNKRDFNSIINFAESLIK